MYALFEHAVAYAVSQSHFHDDPISDCISITPCVCGSTSLHLPLIQKHTLVPPLPLNPQLHRRTPPILPMVMSFAPTPSNPRPHQPLLITQQRQQAKYNRNIAFKLQPHEPVAHCICYIFKVHGLAFYQHANGYDGVEGRGGGFGRRGGERGQIGGGAKQVSGSADDASGGGLDL